MLTVCDVTIKWEKSVLADNPRISTAAHQYALKIAKETVHRRIKGYVPEARITHVDTSNMQTDITVYIEPLDISIQGLIAAQVTAGSAEAANSVMAMGTLPTGEKVLNDETGQWSDPNE